MLCTCAGVRSCIGVDIGISVVRVDFLQEVAGIT